MKFKWMLFIGVLILAAIACGTSADSPAPAAPAEPATPDWPEFTSETGGFTVLMPATPTEDIRTVPSDAGDMSLYIYMVDQGNFAIGVMFNDLPDALVGVTDEATITSMLDGGRDGALGNIGGILVSEEDIAFSGYPGRHIIFDIPDESIAGGGKGVARFILTDSRLYQLLAIGETDAFSDADVQMFLNSFKLTK